MFQVRPNKMKPSQIQRSFILLLVFASVLLMKAVFSAYVLQTHTRVRLSQEHSGLWNDTSHSHGHGTNRGPTRRRHDNGGYKLVLFWNSLAGQEDFGIGTGRDVLRNLNCSVYQCRLSADKDDLDIADALVFNGYQLTRDDIPQRGHGDQVFVFFAYQSPMQVHKARNLRSLSDTFNLTFTYLNDERTDIVATLGKTVRRTHRTPREVPTLDELKGKKKLVLWIVSNGWPNTIGMEYARELQNYVPVDIYVSCGDLSCPLDQPGISCLANLSRHYMFYLAFEDSFCRDYHTEKITNAFHYKMVPITFGGSNYTEYMPPYSFIDVRDYGSVKELADRLLYLRNNLSEYREYFLWQLEYRVKSYRKEGFCRLCEILHTPNYTYKSNFDVNKYWYPTRYCLSKYEQARIFNMSIKSYFPLQHVIKKQG